MLRSATGSIALLCTLVTAAHADEAIVDPLTPFELVTQLDLECRPAHGPPPAPSVFVRQLNPVLQGRIPNQPSPLGELEEVCVPVAKNGQIPSPQALDVIKWIDVACYRAASPPTGVDLTLSHLNPVLANLPDENVTLAELEQICLPVRKNDSVIPEQVERMVSHFDLGCYRLEEPTPDADLTLVLGHLNPVIRAMQLPNRVVHMRRAWQLCVPIAKNDQPVPPGPLARIRWADFLKYRVVPQAPIPPLPLWLGHLNPLYAALPKFFTILEPERIRLMVPVAKDGHIPPGGPQD